MANIQISNLYATGSELFKDSESFMTELVDNELGAINGGVGLTSPTPDSPKCHPLLVSKFNSVLCKPAILSLSLL
jgi:hypothetical protein